MLQIVGCVYTYLKEYLARTEKLRGQETQLLISFQKPYKGVSTDTIGRWAKTVLSQAGIDTAIFSAYFLFRATQLKCIVVRYCRVDVFML